MSSGVGSVVNAMATAVLPVEVDALASVDDALPGSPQSSPQQQQKQQLRASLADKSRAAAADINHRIEAADAALTKGNQHLEESGVGQEEDDNLHRKVSRAIVEQETAAHAQQWDITLRASRLLHEKVAQQLNDKSARRRAQRDVLKKWAVVANEPLSRTRVQRMVHCCGCSSHSSTAKKPVLLSERPMTEAAIMFSTGDWSEAMKAYDHALLMMGKGELEKQAEAHLVRCECLLRLKDYASMEAEADALLRTTGENWAGYRMRGTARFYLGKLQAANQDYDAALRNKVPKGALAGFAGSCSPETEAAIRDDRDQLNASLNGDTAATNEVRQVLSVATNENENLTNLEVRQATETRIGT